MNTKYIHVIRWFSIYVRIFCELRRGEEKYEQWAKCPLVLYAKPSNKSLLFHYKKNCYFAIGFYFLGKSIQKHPDSVCENDVNNEQNVGGYYMPNHWTRGWFSTAKKNCYFGFYFLVRVSKTSWFSFIRRCSPCCKQVKLGHYSVLWLRILRLLLTLYGKMT